MSTSTTATATPEQWEATGVCATLQPGDTGHESQCRALLLHLPEMQQGERWAHLHNQCENCWPAGDPQAFAHCEFAGEHGQGMCENPRPIRCARCAAVVNPEMVFDGHTDCSALSFGRCCGCCGGGGREHQDPDRVYDALRDSALGVADLDLEDGW